MALDESQKQMLWSHPSSLVYEKKLDTALRKTSIRMMTEMISHREYNDYNFDTKLLLRHVRKDDLLYMDTDNSCYAKILKLVFSDSSSRSILFPRKSQVMTKCYEYAKQNLKLQHDYSSQTSNLQSKHESTRLLNIKLQGLQSNVLIQNLMATSGVFRNIIDKTAYTKRRLPNTMNDDEKLDELSKDTRIFLEPLGLTIVWSIHHCVILFSDSSSYLLPMSYLLLIHNKLSDLVSVLLLAQYQSGVCHEQNAYTIVVNFVKELSRLSIKYRDKFAVIAGCIEGMIIAEILYEAEDWENTDLLENIKDELHTSIGYNYMSSSLRGIILQSSIPLRNELGCLSKILGHPFVNIEAGAKKLHKRTTIRKELTYKSVIWVVNKAKETFVRNYITRHRRWPPCTISMTLPGKDPLLNANLRNLDPYHQTIIDQFGHIEIDDWARVELGKVMEFQELENIIPFLKDKSISVLRNQAVQSYIEHSKVRSHRWEDTRLLLYYLLNPLRKLDHQKFLKAYTKSENLDELADYLIIRLVPKEKENKIEFRGFGVKTYLDRLRNLTQEKNVSKFLDLYCDEQSMTMSEIDISKRLYAYRTILKAYKGYKVLYVNFDSSGWNNCFRDETVCPVIRETLSNIFGNNVMHRIHEGYEKSLYMIPDGDNTYHWEGQQGGIDGLNQYAWVWVYVNQIKYAMKDLPVKYHMLCKGDDMRLAILIHPTMLTVNTMKHYHELIVNRVETVAKEFGHEIKVQESYGSEKYFTFSKNASIGTIELPQGFRKIQKVYGANNAMIAVLDEYIASSFSNAHSSCRCMTNTYGAYFTALVWSYWQIMISGQYKRLSDKQVMSLLLIPNMLGGFPIIYLHNMRVRAESDLLSPFLDMLHYTSVRAPDIHKCLSNFLICQVSRKINMTRLYRDPYCLNIYTPTLPVALLRSFILPVLTKKVRNKDIKDLIKATKSYENKIIINCLSSAQPQNAKILSSIYAATPEGILGELLRKFESGRSILDLFILRMGRHQSDKKLGKVLSCEDRLQAWRQSKMRGERMIGTQNLATIHYDRCPAKFAQNLRNATWKAEITGISMPPLQHQIILEEVCNVSEDCHAKDNHFLYEYDPPHISIDDTVSPHWMVAEKQPFLGYTTRTGNITPSVSFQDKDPLIIKVKNLLDLFSWVLKSKDDDQGNPVNSNVDQLIKVVLGMYTDISHDDLIPFAAQRRSGTVQHHARAPRFRESIVPNILSNMYHNVTGQSDAHVTLRTSDQHFRLNFLHIMCECIHMIHVELETSSQLTSPRITWGVTTPCVHCTTPIEEDPIIVDLTSIYGISGKILNACRLENVSKKLILKSYNDFNENPYKMVDDDSDPSIDLAIVATATEFVYHSFHSHTTLQTRFTNHALTNEGYNTLVNLTHKTTSRDIGFTEIKKMSSIAIIQALAYPIYAFIETKLGYMDNDDILVMLQKIHSYELPWYRILELLHKCRRLSDLIITLQRMTKLTPPACFENPATASSYVGYCVNMLVTNNILPLQIALRTYMSKEQAVAEYNFLITPYKWKMLKEFFMDEAKAWVPGNDNDDLRKLITLRAVYIIYYDIDVDALAEYVAEHTISNVFNDIDLRNFMEIDIGYIQMTLDDEHDKRNRLFQWFEKRYPSWPWRQCIEDIMNDDQDGNLIGQIYRFSLTIKISIGFCDIASSIHTVRQGINEELELNELCDHVSSDDTNFNPINRVDFITCYGINKAKCEGVFLLKCRKGTDGLNTNIVVMDQDFSYDKTVFDDAHFYRLYGSQVTSQTKLDHILTITNTKRELPSYIQCLCAADGYGGFVEYLSCITTDSVFVFNTLSVTPGLGAFPYSATESLRQNDNKVDNTLLSQGLDDLSTEECTKNLENPSSLYTVITCDADIKWDDYVTSEKITHNVIRIYIKGTIPQSLLIMKMNLGFANLVINTMSYLRICCNKVYLIRCPQSNIGGEVYIFAYEHSKVSRLPSLSDYKANDDERRYFNDYYMKYYFQFRKILTRSEYDLRPTLRRGYRKLYDELVCACDSKFVSRLGIDINIHTIVQNGRTKGQVYDIITNRLEQQMKVLHGLVFDHKKYVIRKVTYDQDTLTHWRISSMRLITCYAVLDIINTFRIHARTDKAGIRTKFCNLLYTLPRKLGLWPVHKDMYKASYRMQGMKLLNPYSRFFDGYRLGQMVIGYVEHSRLRLIDTDSLDGNTLDEIFKDVGII